MPQDITLRDGRTTAPLAVVLAAMQSLRHLRGSDEAAFDELVNLCFKPRSFRGTPQSEVLIAEGMITVDDGRVKVRGLVHAIIHSCSEGGEWVHELPYEIATHESF